MALGILTNTARGLDQGLNRVFNAGLGYFAPAYQNNRMVLTGLKVVLIGGSLMLGISGGLSQVGVDYLCKEIDVRFCSVEGAREAILAGATGLAFTAALGTIGAYLNYYYPSAPVASGAGFSLPY